MVCNKQVKLGEDDWVARKWQQFLGTISYPQTNYHCQDNSQLTATAKLTTMVDLATGFQLTTVKTKQESSLQTVHQSKSYDSHKEALSQQALLLF